MPGGHGAFVVHGVRGTMIETLLDRWRRADDLVAALEKGVVVLAVIVMVGAVFGQSLLRVVFEKNLFGATELATILLVWVGFISASLATRDKRHIVVDAVPRLLGERTSAVVLNAIVSLATFIFLVYLVQAAIAYYESPGVQFRTSTALRWEMKYIVIALPVAMSIMAVRFLQLGLEELAIVTGLYPVEKRRQSDAIQELMGGETAEEMPAEEVPR